MPIRFACPQCRQKLSISSRRAGQTATCPRCRSTLTIPTTPPERPMASAPVLPPFPAAVVQEQEERQVAQPPPAPQPAAAQQEQPPADAIAAGVQTPGPLPEPPPERPSAVLPKEEAAAPPPEPTAFEPNFAPDVGSGFEGLELVYDSPAPEERSEPPPVASDLIAVPRYAIYLQGGLLALVAFLAFVIGILAGGTLLSGPAAPAAPQACVISGSITYVSGPRQLPDEGAVIAVIPQSQNRPDEKVPVVGLRPGDPTPDADHRGIAILREFGGGYTRADAGGRFQLQVPSQGRYLLLVISHEKPAGSEGPANSADIVKLGPYFANAADLLGDRRYQLTQETLRGDKQLSVAFQ